MNLETIKKMVSDVVASGKTPKTLLLTVEDAQSLSLPMWTRHWMGMKVVIASNWPKTEVTPHEYTTVEMHKTDELELKEYNEAQEQKLKIFQSDF